MDSSRNRGEERKKERRRKTIVKRGRVRFLGYIRKRALKSHQPSSYPFHLFSPLSPRRLVFRSYFICFAYPRRSGSSRRFRGNLLYARYVAFPPSRFHRRSGVATLTAVGIVSFDSDRPLTLTMFLWDSHQGRVVRARTETRQLVCLVLSLGHPRGVETLLHLFRANSPLKTAYTPSSHPLPSSSSRIHGEPVSFFFLTCREAVLVKRLRVNSVKEGL